MKGLIGFLAALSFLVMDSKVNAQVEISKNFKYEYRVNSLADTFLLDTLMSSMSIGIYYKGEEYFNHYGELDPGKNNTPTNNTIYDIGSISKTFIGTLVAMAETEGKLSIEDDVRKYLDGEYPNLQFENEAIRIKHLVTHTGRLPRYLPEAILNEFEVIDEQLPVRISKIESSYSKEMFLKDLKTVELDTLPGYKYTYSNAGGELISYILEKVYEQPFEMVLNKLCSAAKMNSTHIDLPDSKKEHYANGYGDYRNQTPGMKTALWGGSGHAKSTTVDLMNYMKYHLDKNNEIAQRSHQILYHRDVIDGDPRNKIAYMWQVGEDRDFGRLIKHHGGAYGVQNWIMIYPEEDIAINIITNQSGWQTAGKLLTVIYSLLDEMAIDN